MINKVLIWWGLAVTAILVIENMVLPNTAYVLWDNNSKGWILSLISTVIGAWIGYGLKGLKDENTHNVDEEYDF